MSLEPRCPGCGTPMCVTEVSCFVCRVKAESRVAAAASRAGHLAPGERRELGTVPFEETTATIHAMGGHPYVIVTVPSEGGGSKQLRYASPGWVIAMNAWALQYARRRRVTP